MLKNVQNLVCGLSQTSGTQLKPEGSEEFLRIFDRSSAMLLGEPSDDRNQEMTLDVEENQEFIGPMFDAVEFEKSEIEAEEPESNSADVSEHETDSVPDPIQGFVGKRKPDIRSNLVDSLSKTAPDIENDLSVPQFEFDGDQKIQSTTIGYNDIAFGESYEVEMERGNSSESAELYSHNFIAKLIEPTVAAEENLSKSSPLKIGKSYEENALLSNGKGFAVESIEKSAIPIRQPDVRVRDISKPDVSGTKANAIDWGGSPSRTREIEMSPAISGPQTPEFSDQTNGLIFASAKPFANQSTIGGHSFQGAVDQSDTAAEPATLPVTAMGDDVALRGALRSVEPANTLPKQSLTQISFKIVENVNSASDGLVEITLEPEELGKLRMQIVRSEVGWSLNVVVERPETLDLMRRHLDQLQKDLVTSGYEDLQIELGNGQNSGGEGFQQGANDGLAVVEIENEALVPDRSDLTVPGSLDIRI